MLLIELPTVWNFFKELWNRHRLSSKSDKNETKDSSEIKTNEIQTKHISNIPQTFPTEIQSTQIESNIANE